MAEEVPGDYITKRKDLHDCFFLVGTQNQEKVSTMKAFLINYSPYFRAMLVETDMKERNREVEIEIPNHEPDVFKLMLSFTYGNHDLQFKDFNQAMRFHLLVDMTLMTKLKVLSSDYLVKNCDDNVYNILYCAVILNIDQLLLTAEEIVQEDTESVLNKDDFLQFPHSFIMFIVKQETLSVSETELWKAVVKWAKHNSNGTENGQALRKTLGKILSQVRFLTMSLQDFSNEVFPLKVFDPKEVNAIYVSMSTGEDCKLPSVCCEKENRHKYHIIDFPNIQGGNVCVFHSFINVYSKPITLKSVILSDKTINPNTLLSIKLRCNKEVIAEASCHVKNNVSEIVLDQRFNLKADTTYSLIIGTNIERFDPRVPLYKVRYGIVKMPPKRNKYFSLLLTTCGNHCVESLSFKIY